MAWDHEKKTQEANLPDDEKGPVDKAGAPSARQATDTFTCPGCGKHTYGGTAYCPDCGSRLLMECPHCGVQWRYVFGYSFCPECGGKLNPREGTADRKSSRGREKAPAQTGETS